VVSLDPLFFHFENSHFIFFSPCFIDLKKIEGGKNKKGENIRKKKCAKSELISDLVEQMISTQPFIQLDNFMYNNSVSQLFFFCEWQIALMRRR